MPSHREEYVALLDERQLSSPVELEKERVREGAPSERATGSIHLVTTILCIFVLLDVAVYGYIVQLLRASNIDTGSLELRNSYIGLDELYHETTLVNSSHHEPIINLARRVGQVSSTDPHKPSPVDAHRMLTPFGLMAPPDRNLLVSSDTRTILQFRVIDYGMEKCQLALRLPALDDELPDPFLFEGDDSGVAMLDVCELDASNLLNLPSLTWSNRPACQKRVGTFAASPGKEVRLQDFPCNWGTLHSYEISCATPSNCMVDVWSNQNTTWGVYLYQHQTV